MLFDIWLKRRLTEVTANYVHIFRTLLPQFSTYMFLGLLVAFILIESQRRVQNDAEA